MLGKDLIENALQTEYRPFFNLFMVDVPHSAAFIAKPFAVAADLILSKIRSPRRIKIIVGTSPFVVQAGVNQMQLTLNEPTINSSFSDAIFIDWKKLSDLQFEYQVASILEEFVHVFMNIANEELAVQVVGRLYSEIRIVNGRYSL